MAVALPAGYTRLLLPAYAAERDAPPLPLFGYTFACSIGDRLHVAAMRTDESEDWEPRRFAEGELEALVAARVEREPDNGVLRQVALCSVEYGCFTAQNVFLERGEAALPRLSQVQCALHRLHLRAGAGRGNAVAAGAHRRRDDG